MLTQFLSSKLSCYPEVLNVVMLTRGANNDAQYDLFPIQVDTKQGCVPCPIIFNPTWPATALDALHFFKVDDAISIRYRLNCSIFNLKRLKFITNALSKTHLRVEETR